MNSLLVQICSSKMEETRQNVTLFAIFLLNVTYLFRLSLTDTENL